MPPEMPPCRGSMPPEMTDAVATLLRHLRRSEYVACLRLGRALLAELEWRQQDLSAVGASSGSASVLRLPPDPTAAVLRTSNGRAQSLSDLVCPARDSAEEAEFLSSIHVCSCEAAACIERWEDAEAHARAGMACMRAVQRRGTRMDGVTWIEWRELCFAHAALLASHRTAASTSGTGTGAASAAAGMDAAAAMARLLQQLQAHCERRLAMEARDSAVHGEHSQVPPPVNERLRTRPPLAALLRLVTAAVAAAIGLAAVAVSGGVDGGVGDCSSRGALGGLGGQNRLGGPKAAPMRDEALRALAAALRCAEAELRSPKLRSGRRTDEKEPTGEAAPYGPTASHASEEVVALIETLAQMIPVECVDGAGAAIEAVAPSSAAGYDGVERGWTGWMALMPLKRPVDGHSEPSKRARATGREATEDVGTGAGTHVRADARADAASAYAALPPSLHAALLDCGTLAAWLHRPIDPCRPDLDALRRAERCLPAAWLAGWAESVGGEWGEWGASATPAAPAAPAAPIALASTAASAGAVGGALRSAIATALHVRATCLSSEALARATAAAASGSPGSVARERSAGAASVAALVGAAKRAAMGAVTLSGPPPTRSASFGGAREAECMRDAYAYASRGEGVDSPHYDHEPGSVGARAVNDTLQASSAVEVRRCAALLQLLAGTDAAVESGRGGAVASAWRTLDANASSSLAPTVSHETLRAVVYAQSGDDDAAFNAFQRALALSSAATTDERAAALPLYNLLCHCEHTQRHEAARRLADYLVVADFATGAADTGGGGAGRTAAAYLALPCSPRQCPSLALHLAPATLSAPAAAYLRARAQLLAREWAASAASLRAVLNDERALRGALCAFGADEGDVLRQLGLAMLHDGASYELLRLLEGRYARESSNSGGWRVDVGLRPVALNALAHSHTSPPFEPISHLPSPISHLPSPISYLHLQLHLRVCACGLPPCAHTPARSFAPMIVRVCGQRREHSP